MNENKDINNLHNEEIEADQSLSPKVNRELSSSALKVIIDTHSTAVLNTIAKTYDPTNIAHALEGLSQEDLLFFFKSVNSDDSAEIFTYLEQETKESVVQAFSSSELHKIVDSMATDDLVDFVDELPANLIHKVLMATSPEDKAQINAYLNFKEDSAGTLMTPEYMSVRDTDTVKTALAKIKKYGEKMETIWEIFVVDSTRKLVGSITLDKLVEADKDEVTGDIMTNIAVAVQVNTDQEIVLQYFRKYDVAVIPVTNASNRMLGIITFDDAMDVANDENTEDTMISSAVIPNDTPYLKTSIIKLVKSYGIWLILLLVLNTFTSMVLSYLSALGPLLLIPVLTAFLPTVMGTNGNASDQTATVTVRELALGNITTKNYFKAMWKELRASLITASLLAIFAFGWILVELYSGLISLTVRDTAIIDSICSGNRNVFFLMIAALVSLTFLVTTTLAKLLGISLPVLAKLVHLDPAVMSQPVISTILDIISIVFYFLFSTLIFRGI